MEESDFPRLNYTIDKDIIIHLMCTGELFRSKTKAMIAIKDAVNEQAYSATGEHKLEFLETILFYLDRFEWQQRLGTFWTQQHDINREVRRLQRLVDDPSWATVEGIRDLKLDHDEAQQAQGRLTVEVVKAKNEAFDQKELCGGRKQMAEHCHGQDGCICFHYDANGKKLEFPMRNAFLGLDILAEAGKPEERQHHPKKFANKEEDDNKTLIDEKREGNGSDGYDERSGYKKKEGRQSRRMITS